MLRDQNLIPLSRQHQHALALCVRIDRASPLGETDLPAWQTEIVQHFENEIKYHFAAEERVLFLAARKHQELIPLIDELLIDHEVLRQSFALAEARKMSAADLSALAQRMSAHIRKEERQLFERVQELMNREEIALVGHDLEEALKDAAAACILPNEKTQLSQPE
jgi:hemerythrin-like domain-containing protein